MLIELGTALALILFKFAWRWLVRKIKLRLAALLVFAPLVGHADPILFEWTNSGTDGALVSGSGTWTIDESDISPGFGNYTAAITGFAFDWVTTNNTFSVSSAAGNFVGEVFLTFDDSLALTGFRVCFVAVDDPSEGCAASTERPLILVRSNLWGATGGDDDENPGSNNTNFVFNTIQTVAVSRVQTVPEPGTIGLLGIGLAALGFARRRKARA